ncbi:MAG TPA: sigma-70 family RNA polymerase sigma factor, partial [Verrucomicrobiae bacterium]|nr:sigma-70 family RNA polymerase sigma factor [Verrucomicrobiae bacterium]
TMLKESASNAHPATFVTTHWSVVSAARDKDSPQADQALEILCRSYWYPLYVFVRRQGHGPEDAEDLVQEFFARLLQKHYLDAVEPERGRFRTFLIMALKRFMANEWDRSRAQKRGGGQELLPLDTSLAEGRYREECPVEMEADLAFGRQWALTLLDEALTRLGDEQKALGKSAEFELLRPFLTVGTDPVSYGTAARKLGVTEVAVRMAVHRLRRRYRQVFREALAQTVATPAEVNAEMQYLLEILSR